MRTRDLARRSIPTLWSMYRADDALFSYRTWLADGTFVNDFAHPQTVRYTINTLLGLGRAARAGWEDVRDFEQAFSAFQRRHAAGLEEPADEGLNLVLLVEQLGNTAVSRKARERVGKYVDAFLGRLNMQDLAWLLWGSAAAARAGLPGAASQAHRFFATLNEQFVAGSGLPRHSTRRYRRNVVSFGSLVYFLRACHEYASSFSDERARSLFDGGLRYALSIQGPRGEWPWLFDARSGNVIDPYPVFSVHQDSMAPLFLLPAVDSGFAAAKEAVDRSVAWNDGANELAQPMYVEEPHFFAYRSIERAESAPRARRYLRSVRHPHGKPGVAFGGARVRLNPECRSYHLGWLLYTWADRVELAEERQPALSGAT